MDKGDLVPDAVTIQIFTSEDKNPESGIFYFTVSQISADRSLDTFFRIKRSKHYSDRCA
jgi:hypothetical protein